MLRFLAHQNKDNSQLKNRKQPDLPENQTAWESNNQGAKEETFTQSGGGDVSHSREDKWQGGSWLQIRAGEAVAGRWAVPHSSADKIGGTTQE